MENSIWITGASSGIGKALALKFAKNNKKPVHFIGSGSNLLVSDEGISGMVITLGKSFKNIFFKENKVLTYH